jgi:hypothetical protein
VNPLGLRKELLIAESEINRAQLLEGWHGMTGGIRGLADRAQSVGSLASTVAVLVAGLAALQCGKPVDADAKPSWLQTVLKSAGMVSTVWLAFRGRPR